MDNEINGFMMNQGNFHHNGNKMNTHTRKYIHIPKNKCKQVFHNDKMSCKIDFKVSEAIKKIADDMTPMSNYMQVPLKMPVDNTLKTCTWKDARELVVDPIVQQIHKQNNNMNYARKVVDDIEEQTMTHIDACDRTFQDLKVLWSNYE